MSPFGCQCVVGSDAVVVAGSVATVYQSIAVQNKIPETHDKDTESLSLIQT
jgi:hypothetical protein